MTDGWQAFFAKLIRAGLMVDFVDLMNAEALFRTRQAAQVGQQDDIRRDALADVRFCLCKADNAAKALTEAKRQANLDASRGFQEGGDALA